MFALIETKGATHIAISIPREGADKTIPALSGMLENNAVFICKSYSTLETCVPEMSIQLGNLLKLENGEGELAIVVPGSPSVLDDSFVYETPEILVSNKRRIEEKDKEINRLRLELQHQKQQLSDLQERMEGIEEED
jgi:hypothetical protein